MNINVIFPPSRINSEHSLNRVIPIAIFTPLSGLINRMVPSRKLELKLYNWPYMLPYNYMLPSGHVCSMLECSTSWSIGHHIWGYPLQCCMCFFRDPNYFATYFEPWGFLPLHSGGSTVLLSDKKKSGYTVEYWIFKTAQKGYLRRGLLRINRKCLCLALHCRHPQITGACMINM